MQLDERDVSKWFELVVAGDLEGTERLLAAGVDPTTERDLEDAWREAIERSRRERFVAVIARPGGTERAGHQHVFALLEPLIDEPERAHAAAEFAAAVKRSERRDALGERLVEAACNEPDDEVAQLLAEGAPVDHVAADLGYSSLMYAAMYGRLKVVEALLAAGADVAVACRSENPDKGRTALAFAAQASRYRVSTIRRLVAAGADPNATDGMGKTPLLLAVDRGHEDAVVALIEAGSNPHVADHSGRTPLRAAAFESKSLRDAIARAAVDES